LKIGVDIDGVIADFVTAFRKLVEKRYDVSLSENDIYAHDLFLVLGVPEQEAKELIRETLVTKLKLVPNAKKSLAYLSRYHKIFVITARPKDLLEQTRKWLKSNGISYHEIVHQNEGEKHGSKLKLDVIIEDNLTEAIRWKGKAKNVLVFDHPWNKSLNVRRLITRVRSWEDIVRFIDNCSQKGDRNLLAKIQAQA